MFHEHNISILEQFWKDRETEDWNNGYWKIRFTKTKLLKRKTVL